MLRTIHLVAVVGLASLCAAQTKPSLYYVFEGGGGDRVLNFASESGVAPADGKLVSTSAKPWVPGIRGRFALGGRDAGKHTYVDTGWKGPLQGELAAAWFMKARTGHGAGPSFFFSNIGDFRAFTGGAAGKGIVVSGWGGRPDLALTADVQAAAKKGWVHVALVIDASKKQATYYVDGKAEKPIAINRGANVPGGGTTFRIGAHKDVTTSTAYDIDEFILWPGAVDAATIGRWKESGYAAGTPFGKPCGTASMISNGKRPVLGGSFGVVSKGTPNALCCQMVGSNRLKFMSWSVPFDMGTVFPPAQGKGCFVWTAADYLVLTGALPPSGRAVAETEIPNNPWLLDQVLYTQSLFMTADRKVFEVTNGYAFVIKRY